MGKAMIETTRLSSESRPTRFRTGGSPTRDAIAACTPVIMQPFLTWLTACPIDGQVHRERKGSYCVWVAFSQAISGILTSLIGFYLDSSLGIAIYTIGTILTTSSLGFLQVGVFHYCSHGTVFSSRFINNILGHLVSGLCLLPDFKRYQSRHMRHHSYKVLLTDEDEFTELVVDKCGLKPGVSKRDLWLRVLLTIVSPRFHACFMLARLSLTTSGLRTKRGCAVAAVWSCTLSLAYLTGVFEWFAVCVLIPLSVPFQITIVLRTPL